MIWYDLIWFGWIWKVPERVRAMNSSIKLLLIVREPVTRAISDYTQLRSHAASGGVLLGETTTTAPSTSSSNGHLQHSPPGPPLTAKITPGDLAPPSLQENSTPDNGHVSSHLRDNGDDITAKLNAVNVTSNNNYPAFSTVTGVNLSNVSLILTTPPSSRWVPNLPLFSMIFLNVLSMDLLSSHWVHCLIVLLMRPLS